MNLAHRLLQTLQSRYSSKYFRRFARRKFVIKVGGELLTQPEHLKAIAQDLAVLHQARIACVLVHGGGPQLDAFTKKMGLPPARKIHGRRITTREELDLATMVFAGTINTQLVAALRPYQLPAIGLTGADASLFTVSRRPPLTIDGGVVDFGFVGDVDTINSQPLQDFFEAGYLPVIASLSCDNKGQLYNVNADTVATKLAAALEVEKLIMMTNMPGVLVQSGDPKSRISILRVHEIQPLIDAGVITGGMVAKVLACAEAVQEGVPSAHIVGVTRHALLKEVFSEQGAGTMVVAE